MPDPFDPRTQTTDPRVGPYDDQAALAAAEMPEEAARLSAVADQEMWAVGWNQWMDVHRKLNTYRNGIMDDPVKDHEGYVVFESDRPFEVWEDGLN